VRNHGTSSFIFDKRERFFNVNSVVIEISRFGKGFIRRRETNLKGFVKRIPLFTPKKMFDMLSQLGYKGQEHARKCVCLMAYRHLRRLKNIYVHNIKREKLPPKSNYILMGPTGCGKTFLIELLFREILKLPTIIIDITGFTETGYVGRDPITILTSLIHQADGDIKKASIGIICLDEFDKIATTQNIARFEGAGSTKDVSGYGVQKELLKLLSSTQIEVPLEYHGAYTTRYVKMSTDDICFIACGAFSGFKSLIYADKPKIGFAEHSREEFDEIAYNLEEDEAEQLQNFFNYGFLPELIGRFSRIITLQPLSRSTLKNILSDNVIKKYLTEFQQEGISLKIDTSVLDYLVDKALEKKTGARGLESELIKIIEDVAFEYFGHTKGELCISVKGGKIVRRLKSKARSAKPRRIFA
jgi:ATP-dependent Clp protease ATP-binding subunit ClpX